MKKMIWKIVACIAIYLVIGVCLTFYRLDRMDRRQADGGALLAVMLVYPFTWPLWELGLLEKDRAAERQRLATIPPTDGLPANDLDRICPPALIPLFRDHLEKNSPPPPSRQIIDILLPNAVHVKDAQEIFTLDLADPRSGYVLNTLACATARTGEKGELTQVSAVLLTPSSEAERIAIAAAIARGMVMQFEQASGGAREDLELAITLALDTYERLLEMVREEDPYSMYAYGTALEAAARHLAPTDARDYREEARRAYRKAMRSDDAAAALPAAVLWSGLAENDAERTEVLTDMLRGLEGDPALDHGLPGRPKNASVVGKILFPLIGSDIEPAFSVPDGQKGAMDEQAVWREWATQIVQTFDNADSARGVLAILRDRGQFLQEDIRTR